MLVGWPRQYPIDQPVAKLGDEAAAVGNVLAIAHAPALEQRCVLHPGIAVVVHEGRERYSQLLAIAQQRRVMPRNARRAGVEVQIRIGIETALLRIAALLDAIPAAQGEIAPARAA